MSILRQPLLKMKIWASNKIFQIYFGGFYYPFENADEKFLQMPKDEKIIYLSSVHKWTESQAYKNESQSLIRHIYGELATKPLDQLQITAYRLSLMFIRDYDKRMKDMSNKYKELIK